MGRWLGMGLAVVSGGMGMLLAYIDVLGKSKVSLPNEHYNI